MATQVIDKPLDPTARAGVPQTAQAILGNDGFAWRLSDAGGHSLAASVWRLTDGPYPTLAAALSELRPLLNGAKLLGQPVPAFRYAFANAWATLVPRRLFDAQQLSLYFKLLLPAGEYDYGYTALPVFDCYVVYAVEPEVKRLASLYYPEGEAGHVATALIQGFHGVARERRHESALGLQVQGSGMQIVGLERGHLLFYNHFPIEAPNDVLYYTLLAYEQCRLRPAQTPLLLSGDVRVGSEVHTLLTRAIRQLEYVPVDPLLGVEAFALRYV